MPLRALLFDLWGTLLVDNPQRDEQRRKTRVRLLGEAFATVGHPFAVDAISSAFPTFIRDQNARQVAGCDLSMPEKVELFLESLEAGLARQLTEEDRLSVEEALVAPTGYAPPLPAPGALDALQAARAHGLGIGLVSNTGLTPGYVLRNVLADHRLREHLDVLTFSDEARLAKPTPEVFQCTLDALGVAPNEAVFIGDVPLLDVARPREMGMWTVLIGDARVEDVEPHACIETLHELFDALRQLGLVD